METTTENLGRKCTLTTYDDSGTEVHEIDADTEEKMREVAEEICGDILTSWESDGDYEERTMRWAITDWSGCEVDSDSYTVQIDADHDRLIRDAGGDADCDHDWTSEGEGGCIENPGVYSRGGTTISTSDHCRKCGLHRDILHRGSQRNPGEAETSVSYRQPEEEDVDEASARASRNEP